MTLPFFLLRDSELLVPKNVFFILTVTWSCPCCSNWALIQTTYFSISVLLLLGKAFRTIVSTTEISVYSSYNMATSWWSWGLHVVFYSYLVVTFCNIENHLLDMWKEKKTNKLFREMITRSRIFQISIHKFILYLFLNILDAHIFM